MSRILVGDDNEQMRRLIVELLEAEGHEVSQANDTGQVLEQVSRAMSGVDDITQRNAAAAEELAAMAEELSAQAAAMQQMAGIFRIPGSAEPSAARRATTSIKLVA